MIPISALQHWLYCPRQCALIHVERAWSENAFTAEGRVLHEHAHSGTDESRPGLRITRSLPVSSESLGLTGQCDIVEFYRDGTVVPVEYKRGKPKVHRADEAQLCAQAMCLEQMLHISIPQGFLFYGKARRRSSVSFDSILRDLVRDTSTAIQNCLDSGITPVANYDPKLCDACSLIDICQPRAMRWKQGAAAWFTRQIDKPSLYP